MSEIIQCPTCAKKFRLPASPPAEFTCTSCGTVMDLSGFGAPAEPAMAAAPSARGAPAAGGAPTASRGRVGGRRRAGKARRRYAAHDHVEEHGRRGYRHKDNNSALVIGSIAGLVLAVILVVVLMNKDDEAPPEDPTKNPKTTANAGTNQGSGTGLVQPTPIDPTGAAPGTPGGTTPVIPGTPGANPGAGPGAAPNDPNPVPKKPRRTRPRLKNIELQKFDWPEEVDAATRAAAEEHLENMVEVGGRDGRDGEEWFIQQGRKVCGRLISEFPVIVEKDGMGRIGMTKLMVLDRVLSQIDGTLEREWRSRQRITHVTDEKIAMSRLKRWTWWWKSGLWKDTPIKPWDPRVDEIDDEEKEKKKKDAGKGFGKRAGK